MTVVEYSYIVYRWIDTSWSPALLRRYTLLAISNAFLLAVDGAPAASAATAVALARAAVGSEALGGADQLLVVAGALLPAHHRGPHDPSLGVATARATEAASIAARPSAPEPRYPISELTSRAEEPTRITVVPATLVRHLGLGGCVWTGPCEGRRG